MNAWLSTALWLALIMSSCCGQAAGHETEKLTSALYDEYPGVTPTSDHYDLNTIDYSDFPEVEPYIPNKASGMGQLNLLLLLGLAVLQVWD